MSWVDDDHNLFPFWRPLHFLALSCSESPTRLILIEFPSFKIRGMSNCSHRRGGLGSNACSIFQTKNTLPMPLPPLGRHLTTFTVIHYDWLYTSSAFGVKPNGPEEPQSKTAGRYRHTLNKTQAGESHSLLGDGERLKRPAKDLQSSRVRTPTASRVGSKI